MKGKIKITWPIGIIIALLCFICFILYMVFSIEFSKNSFDLVTENYYEEELAYQKEITATHNTSQLKEKPQIKKEANAIIIIFPSDFNSKNTVGRFQLFRPNSKDLDINKKSLDFTPSNTIIIPSNVLFKGNYILKLYWKKENKDYQMEIPILWE